jgi:hypothetical protein
MAVYRKTFFSKNEDVKNQIKENTLEDFAMKFYSWFRTMKLSCLQLSKVCFVK